MGKITSRKEQPTMATAAASPPKKAPVTVSGTAGVDPPTHEQDPCLTISQVARQLGKSPQTISRWIIDGLLVAVKQPSGLFTVRKSQVNKFLGGSALDGRVS